MKKISAIAMSVVLVGSTLMLPSNRYTSSFIGISSAEAARGARVSRSGPRGSVSRSAVSGRRGAAARTTVRTPRGTATRTTVAGPRGAATRATVRTPHGTATRGAAVARPVPGRPAAVRPRPVPVRPAPVRPVPVRPVPPPHGGNYYSGGAVLAAGVAGLAIGAMVASIPPSCTTVIRNGIEYRKCGDTYYQQSFNGSDVVYVVVPAP